MPNDEKAPIAIYSQETQHLRIIFYNGAMLEVFGEDAKKLQAPNPEKEGWARKSFTHKAESGQLSIYDVWSQITYRHHGVGFDGDNRWTKPDPAYNDPSKDPHRRYIEARSAQCGAGANGAAEPAYLL